MAEWVNIIIFKIMAEDFPQSIKDMNLKIKGAKKS